jgi:hypothetical protein
MSDNEENPRFPKWRHKILLDKSNYEIWYKLIKVDLRNFGTPGTSISKEVDMKPTEPTSNSLIPGTNLFQYDHLIRVTVAPIPSETSYDPPHPRLITNLSTNHVTLSNSLGETQTVPAAFGHGATTYTICETLSQQGASDLKDDIKSYKKELAQYLRDSGKLISWALTSFTPETESSLRLNSAFSDACDSNFSYQFMIEVKSSYAHSSNFRVIQARTLAGFQLKQVGTHEDFCHDILDFEKSLQADLGGKTPFPTPGRSPTLYVGQISIRDIVSILYRSGLNITEFGNRQEVFYSQNPTGPLAPGESLEDTMSANSQYSNTRNIDLALQLTTNNEPTSSLATMLPLFAPKFKDGLQSNGAIVIRDGTMTLCRNCHKEFNTTPTKDPTLCHMRCHPCYLERMNNKPLSSPSYNTNSKQSTNSDPKSTKAMEAMLTLFAEQDSDED